MSRESERYEELMGSAPSVRESTATAQAAAALAAAEQAAQSADYSRTADARLDRAINDTLQKSGYIYDISRDNAYREFARDYSQNALAGRTAAQEGANQLGGGYAPTYADTVGSEVSHDIVSNIANYMPAFRSAARQEAAAQTAQAMNAAQALGAVAETEYARRRDTQGDYKNYVSYLANRYSAERQNDVQQGNIASDIYRARLNGAESNLNAERQSENARYQYDTLNADSAAKLGADQQEFDQKMAYTAAKDAYDDRVTAQKAAAKELEKAKETHSKNVDKLETMLNSGKVKYNAKLDYNGDGRLDNRDAVLAARAAETGVVSYDYTPSEGAQYVAEMAERHKSKNFKNFDQYLEDLVDKYRLDNGEAAYVYHYLGL